MKREIDIRDFGADISGNIPATLAFRDAVRTAEAEGIDTVYVPKGRFVTGTIELISGLNLHLSGGAIIEGSSDESEYSHECLIRGEKLEGIRISGGGVVNGVKENWLKYVPRVHMWVPPHLPDDMEAFDGDFFPQDTVPFRPKILELLDCRNVVIEDITLTESAFWTAHFERCTNMVIRGISIINGVADQHVVNADGLDIDACNDVRISDCRIRTSDDAICLKVTETSRGGTCRNIAVSNCILETDECALKLGTESYGDFSRIVLSGCTISNAGGGVAIFMRDGGSVRNVQFSNIVMDLEPGYGGVPFYFWSGKRTDFTLPGSVKNIQIRGILARAAGGGYFSGLPDGKLEEIYLEDVHVKVHGRRDMRLHGRPKSYVENPSLITENPPNPYPVWCMKLAPVPLYFRYVQGVHGRNVDIQIDPDVIVDENLEDFKDCPEKLIWIRDSENIQLTDLA